MRDEINETIARVTVLQYLVRQIYRQKAREEGHSADDVMRGSENVKSWFEANMGTGPAASYMTAAVDNFFTALAKEVAKDLGR